jgi:hypothetical protein
MVPVGLINRRWAGDRSSHFQAIISTGKTATMKIYILSRLLWRDVRNIPRYAMFCVVDPDHRHRRKVNIQHLFSEQWLIVSLF